MERMRRVFLLGAAALAVCLVMWARLRPLVTLEAVDFEAEQKDEGRSMGLDLPTDEEQYLRQLSPSDYVAEVTHGKLVTVEGQPWASLFDNVSAASKGQTAGTEWTRRISPDHEQVTSFYKSLFFRPDEAPIATLREKLVQDRQTLYLALDREASRRYLRLTHQVYSDEDFSFGSGFRRSPRPPTGFLFPYRRLSLLVFALGLCLYVFLPRARKDPGAIAYAGWRIVLGDVVALILFLMFFAAPIFICGGTLQAFTLGWFLIPICWPLALLGALLAGFNASYAAYWLLLLEDRIAFGEDGKRREFHYGQMASFQPVVLRTPRWLTALTWASAAASTGSQSVGAAGRALILSGARYGGLGITLKDGNRLYLWLTDMLGKQALTQAERIPAALEAAGVARIDDVKTLRAIVPPTFEDVTKKTVISRPTLVVLGTAAIPLLFLAAVLAVTTVNKLSSGVKLGRDIQIELKSAEAARDAAVFDPAVEWSRTFTGRGNFDGFTGLRVTSAQDGGLLVYSSGMTGNDVQIYLVKTDPAGQPAWERTLGTERWDYVEAAAETRDLGFVLIGGNRPGPGSEEPNDARIIKIGPSGAAEWDKTLGWPGADTWAFSATEKPEGGFNVAGLSGGAVCLFAIGPQGEPVTSKRFDKVGGEDDELQFVLLHDNGDILAVGETLKPGVGFKDLLLVKLDSSGSVKWRTSCGGKNKETPAAGAWTADGGAVVVGTTRSAGGGGDDVYFVKVDSAGRLLRETSFGDPGDESGVHVQETRDRGFVLLGDAKATPDSLPGLYLVKTDSQGNKEWERRIAPGKQALTAASVLEATGGSFLITGQRTRAGYMVSEAFMLKTRAEPIVEK